MECYRVRTRRQRKKTDGTLRPSNSALDPYWVVARVHFCSRLANSKSGDSGLLLWLAHSPPELPEPHNSLAKHGRPAVEAVGCGRKMARPRAEQGPMAI